MQHLLRSTQERVRFLFIYFFLSFSNKNDNWIIYSVYQIRQRVHLIFSGLLNDLINVYPRHLVKMSSIIHAQRGNWSYKSTSIVFGHSGMSCTNVQNFRTFQLQLPQLKSIQQSLFLKVYANSLVICFICYDGYLLKCQILVYHCHMEPL